MSPRRRRHAADGEGSKGPVQHDEDVRVAQEGQERLLRDDQCGQIEGSAQVSPGEESKSPPVGEVAPSPTIRDRHDNQTPVPIDHPSLRGFIRQMAKDGRTKEDAIKLSGASYEVVDKYYQEQKGAS